MDDKPSPNHQPGGFPMASFINLPAEILLNILANVDRDGLKNLRLAGAGATTGTSLYAVAATELLFSRICISETWSDREKFFAIAKTPHLAAVVHTVAWTEICGRSANMPIAAVSSDTPTQVQVAFRLGGERFREGSGPLFNYEDDKTASLSDVHLYAKRLFWWPIVDNWPDFYLSYPLSTPNMHVISPLTTRDQQMVIQHHAYRDFFPTFLDALRRLPNLASFVSEPMHPCRQLKGLFRGQKYAFTPQLFNFKEFSAPRNRSFYRFLLPAMQQLADDHTDLSSTSPIITHLHVADFMVSEREYIDEPYSINQSRSPFHYITHLELEVDDHLFDWLSMEAGGQHLTTAENLTHLGMSVARTSRNRFRIDPFRDLFDEWGVLPRLKYLSVEKYCGGIRLVPFVHKHRKSLVRMQLETMQPQESLKEALYAAVPEPEITTYVSGAEQDEQDEEDEQYEDEWTEDSEDGQDEEDERGGQDDQNVQDEQGEWTENGEDEDDSDNDADNGG